MTVSPSNAGSQTAELGIDVWLLKRRYEDLGTMFRACWENYIKFYAVFLPFSLGAMGWLVTHTGKDALPKSVSHVIAIVFMAQSLLTAGTSGALALYSRQVGIQHSRTEESVLGDTPLPPALVGTQAIPVLIAQWAAWANCTAMMGMTYAWFYVGFILPRL